MNKQDQVFEIKLQKDGRRFSRHFQASSKEQALEHIPKGCQIIHIRQVHREDIIGRLDVNGIMANNPPKPDIRPFRQKVENMTLDSVVFGNSDNGGDRKKQNFKGSYNYDKEKERYNRSLEVE